MKILLYICGVVAAILGIYEFFWIVKSSLAFIIILLAFILAINSFVLAKRE
ncbi:MAG: hypothetical protein ACYDIA_18425 [Candidatus Humimicrobiaceae bacterium]